MRYIHVCVILSEIYKIVNDAKNSSNIELRDNMIEFIQENYHDPMLSVESIADQFSLSTSYVSRFFKEQVGHSVTDYIHIVRLDRAKELLSNTDSTVSEIAEKVGYNSLHNFPEVQEI